MGSINTNNTAFGNHYVEGQIAAGPWTIAVWARASVLGVGHSAAGVLSAQLGAPEFQRPSFNSRQDDPEIRYGSFDQRIGAFTEVDFADDEWLYYVLSSGGGTSDVRWTIVRDYGSGTWSITETHTASAATLGTTSTNLILNYIGTIGDAARIHDPLLMTSFKVYEADLWGTGAGSGADIIAQARTRSVILPSDLFGSWQWDGSTTTDLDDPDEGSFSIDNWVATGLTTSTDEPSFPDDASAEHELGATGSFSATAIGSASLGQIHALGAIGSASATGVATAALGQIHALGATGSASATVTGSAALNVAIDIGTPLDDQTVFLSGHSLTDQVGVPLELIADGEGEDHLWQEQVIFGGSVAKRSSGDANPYTDRSWLGYRDGVNKASPDSSRYEDLDLVDHFRRLTTDNGSPGRAYSALLLAEGHHLYRAVLYNISVPVHRHYYELIREGSPSCVGYLYSTWLSYVTPMTRTGSGPDIVCRRDAGSAETLFIEIQTSGPIGGSTFRWSLNGGATWVAENVTTADWVEIPGRGVIGIENTGDLVAGATYSHTWDVAPTYWSAHMREQNAATASIASRINLSLAAESRSDRLIVAPVALGLANLIDAATTGGGLAGITEFDGPDIDYQSTLDVIFADAVHPTDVLGKYFLALVCYSTVYRRDCRGVDRPSGVTETQATSLQAVAWDTVVEYFDGRPLGEQLDQAAIKTTFVTHLEKALKINAESHQLASLTSYFSGTESDLQYDSETEDLWLEPPPFALFATGNVSATAVGAAGLDGSEHSLGAVGLVSSTVVGSAVLGQVHALGASGGASATSVGPAPLGQIHALAAIGNASSTSVGAAALGSAQHSLGANGSSSATSVGSPTLGQIHALLAVGLSSATSVGAAALPSTLAPKDVIARLSTTYEPAAGIVSTWSPDQ